MSDFNKEIGIDEDWPYAKELTFEKVKDRVNLARLSTYRNLTFTRDRTSIYFEDIINIFIALVIHPVNFIVLDSKHKMLFHFCRDKQHMSDFESYFDEKFDWNDENTFSLFDYGGSYSRYRIAVIYMTTKIKKKNNKYHVVLPLEYFEYTGSNVGKRIEYIALCAKYFFSDRWEGLQSHSGKIFLDGIHRSIEHIASKSGVVISNGNSSEKYLHNSSGEALKHETDIADSMISALDGIEFSAEFVSNLSHFNDHKDLAEPLDMPGMLLAFRHYNVAKGYERYVLEGVGNSYNYQTQFILSTDMEKGITDMVEYLYPKKIRETGTPRTRRAKRGNLGLTFDTFHDPSKGKYLYSKPSQISKEQRNLAILLDVEFWNLLEEENPTDIFREILRKSSGEKFRSMVDPTYNTGLVHYNRIFQRCGLDRVQVNTSKEVLADNKRSLNRNSSVYHDLMRIVVLFYIYTIRLNKGSVTLNDPYENILCVIFPVKMKGVTWGVGALPYYLESIQNTRHKNVAHWLSIFLLITSSRRNFYVLVDNACWGHAQRVVIRTVNNCIAALGSPKIRKEHSHPLIYAKKELNKSMDLASRYLPYDFPHFDFVGEPEDGVESFPINPKKANGYQLTWVIQTNKYYIPTQSWDKKSTRSYEASIELGLELGRRQWMTRVPSKSANS